MRAHALLGDPPLPRLRRRVRRDGDLRQARLRRRRDRRDAARRPLRAGRRAVLGAGPGGRRRARAPALRAPRPRPRARAGRACGYAIQAGCYFAALERIDASLLSLLLYTFPAIVAAAAIALGRERLDGRRAGRARRSRPGGLVLVVAGAGAGALDPLGAALGLGAAVVYSTYILVSEGIAGRVRPRVLSALVCTGAAATLTAGSALLGELRPGDVTAAGLGLAGLPRRRLDRRRRSASSSPACGASGPTTASILATVEPLVTVLLAFLVFGESARAAAARSAARSCSAPCCARASRGTRGRDAGAAHDGEPLDGKIALVAGATRGAGRGIAVALGEAGATVYCTGRSTREQRSEYDRPETIEETAELVTAAGGDGIAIAVDHLEPGAGRGAGRAHRRRARAASTAGQRHLGRRAPVRVGHAAVGARPRRRPAHAAAGDRHPPDHRATSRCRC